LTLDACKPFVEHLKIKIRNL